MTCLVGHHNQLPLLHHNPHHHASPSPRVDSGPTRPARNLLSQLSTPPPYLLHTGENGRSARQAGSEQLQQHLPHHRAPSASLPVPSMAPCIPPCRGRWWVDLAGWVKTAAAAATPLMSYCSIQQPTCLQCGPIVGKCFQRMSRLQSLAATACCHSN
jgi:hypothetical protein